MSTDTAAIEVRLRAASPLLGMMLSLGELRWNEPKGRMDGSEGLRHLYTGAAEDTGCVLIIHAEPAPGDEVWEVYVTDRSGNIEDVDYIEAYPPAKAIERFVQMLDTWRR